jgi:hypothetical protein
MRLPREVGALESSGMRHPTPPSSAVSVLPLAEGSDSVRPTRENGTFALGRRMDRRLG